MLVFLASDITRLWEQMGLAPFTHAAIVLGLLAFALVTGLGFSAVRSRRWYVCLLGHAVLSVASLAYYLTVYIFFHPGVPGLLSAALGFLALMISTHLYLFRRVFRRAAAGF